MRTSNPALNERTFAPERVAVLRRESIDGPLAAPPDTMRVGGVVEKSAFLLTLVVGAGVFGWMQTDGGTAMPPWAFAGLIGALVLAVVTVFKPQFARITAPAYALLKGFFVGAISSLYNAQFDGIVAQALGLTIGVFLMMLALYSLRIIRVTDKLRMGVVAATGAVFLVYLVSFGLSFFTDSVPMIHDAGLVGIGFSLLVVGVAAFNLLLDFDLIEQGAANGAPAQMEWYAAFGLTVTLVWLYIELLRLLAKLRR
jgi:uncharacterized YccA/Bax inhibitor family protein